MVGRDGNVPGQEEVTELMVHTAESQQFGSLLIAGHLRRGTPVGRIFGGHGDQGTVALGLSERFQLLG